MMRGRKPVPSALSRRKTSDEPRVPATLSKCPTHLGPVARKEWHRLARPLHDAGVLTAADRAALAAYCQAWARWVEAEEKLKETPVILKTPSGYVQQSPWLSIANKQLELMGRYMGELGLTPSARTRSGIHGGEDVSNQSIKVEFVTVYTDEDGNRVEQSAGTWDPTADNNASNSKRIGVNREDQEPPRDIPDEIKKV